MTMTDTAATAAHETHTPISTRGPNLILAVVALAIVAIALAVKTFGVVALTMVALALVPVVFLWLILVSIG